MDTLLSITQTIIDMGATALLPFIILILGLIFGMKVGPALKAGLFVGIGFSGLNLVVNLLTETIQPISDYYSKMGKGFTTLDHVHIIYDRNPAHIQFSRKHLHCHIAIAGHKDHHDIDLPFFGRKSINIGIHII